MSLNDYSSDVEYDEEAEEEEEEQDEEEENIDSSVEMPSAEVPAPAASDVETVASTEAEVVQGGGRSQVHPCIGCLAGQRT